ncbi:probable serine hydrolase [Drosophila hydei]|uniref:Probable serine hydrolase n=1 Tax=Drosophila hydei TaxID=7224 RepID=A0A6J1LI09_DROHY|nr:probable serine hydrolase [Drosophila hydei]
MGTLSLSNYEDVSIWAPWGHIAGRWYGNRSERPILAIHGWMDNLGSYDTLIPYLPDYLGVLCIDLAGHGCSSPLPPGMHYSADDWLLAIGRVMKAYNWQKVSLMGHSLGGILSFVFTALGPHRVDLLITLDVVISPVDSPASIKIMANFMEKHLVEEERAARPAMSEPPSFSLTQLRKYLSKGSNNSVPPELTHHLMYRTVAKSKLYPDKFYFARDGRIKFYTLFPMNRGLGAELTRCLKDTPYLVIKGSDSSFIGPDSDEAIAILKSQNPNFEIYELPGAHHVHLTNAEQCAKHIVRFLRRHRPPKVSSWSLADEDAALSTREHRGAQKRQQHKL